MNIMDMKGTIVPLVTPFTAEETFDSTAMVKLIEFVLDQGADNSMPAGRSQKDVYSFYAIEND